MSRITRAWRALEREQRFAAVAAIGLFVSMFLPWYSKTDTFIERGAAQSTQTSLNAFQAFSFVEAAVLLVSAGVLVMLFARAEGRAFQLPGGDGLIVIIAGGWSAVLIFYRLLDKPTLHGTQRITATVGVEWGIFVALLVALGLVYAGARIRASEAPQAPLTRSPQDRARPPGAMLTPLGRGCENALRQASPTSSSPRSPRHRDPASARRPWQPSRGRPHRGRPDRRPPDSVPATRPPRTRPSRCPSRTRRRPSSATAVRLQRTCSRRYAENTLSA